MRVLLTTDTVGGVWTFTKELTTGLLQAGHTIALVSFGRAPSDEQTQWAAEMGPAYGDGFRFFSSDAPLEWMQNNEQAYSQGAPLLRRVAADFQPGVLHANQFCWGQLDIGCPVVVTAHSDVLSWADACRPEGLAPSPWLTRYTSLVSEGLRVAEAVAAPTQWMLEALGRHFRLPERTCVVPNGRNLAVVPERHPRTLQTVTCGRVWDEAKNISVLAGIDAPLPLLVVGETRHEGVSAPSHVGAARLLGPLREAELLLLFRQSSIYIATSKYEPFGLAVLEAALCGCAVVAHDIPSLREVWDDAALYFHNAQELTQHLRDLSSSPQALLQTRHRSLRRAAHYTTERMTESYLAIYKDVIAERKTRKRESAAEELVAHVS